MWIKILLTCLQFPLSFAKSSNLTNYFRLIKALREEPSEQIINNLKLYLQNNGQSKKVLNQNDRVFNDIQKLQFKNIHLLVSHEATLTGAPLIIKKLAEYWSKDPNTGIIFLLCRPGSIITDFQNIAPTILLLHYDDIIERDHELNKTLEKIKSVSPTINKCYVNSAESRYVLPYLNKHIGCKVISLVHELGNYYPINSWKIIDDYSDHIVFPAEFVRQKAMTNYKFTTPITIQGQGLLKPEILTADRAIYRRSIRKELNISQKSKIILGCGSTIARKGIDLFVYTAISVLNQLLPDMSEVYFIWVGDAPYQDIQLWMDRAIEDAGYKENIRFIGQKKDTIPYFVGSDIFYITSKGDPYPCVVQEAAAAGLPVVGFEGSGGWPEYLPDELKHMIPSGDTYRASQVLCELISQTVSNKMYYIDFKHYSKKLFSL